jgi:hypothetical protein
VRRIVILLTTTTLLAASCGGDSADAPRQETINAEDCIVRLHGKGGTGASTELDNAVAIVSPTGNGEAWDAHQWEYSSAAVLAEAIEIVTAAVDFAGCSAVSVHGFSNGASFAAKLVCSGEDLGGRLQGVVVDDPVTDASSAGCSPADGVELALYWTGALAATAPAGTDCGGIDWTCEGGATVGIDAYAAALGVTAQTSPHDDHQWNLDAPEPRDWLRG